MRSMLSSSLPDRRAARLIALAQMLPNASPVPDASTTSLSARGIAALRAALAECVTEGAGHRTPGAGGLAAAARLLADAARASDPVRGERLLIALKQRWQLLPEVQQLPQGGPRDAVWDRLVVLCVSAFYDGAPLPAAGTATPPIPPSDRAATTP